MGKEYQKKPRKTAAETKGANPRKPSGIPKYQHFPKASLAPYPDEEGNALWLSLSVAALATEWLSARVAGEWLLQPFWQSGWVAEWLLQPLWQSG
jgi:hypothetical protein